MRKVEAGDGISKAEQIRREIQIWLRKQGVKADRKAAVLAQAEGQWFVDEYTPFEGQRREPPGLVLISECWRLLGPSGKPIVCATYEHPHGVEVRCHYGVEHLIRSQLAPHVDIAEDIAAAWKQAAIDKGFTEVN